MVCVAQPGCGLLQAGLVKVAAGAGAVECPRWEVIADRPLHITVVLTLCAGAGSTERWFSGPPRFIAKCGWQWEQ